MRVQKKNRRQHRQCLRQLSENYKLFKQQSRSIFRGRNNHKKRNAGIYTPLKNTFMGLKIQQEWVS
jgi:hypothetical protein